jgi:energy-coupling factor transporter ATP-binding protein EcfA2
VRGFWQVGSAADGPLLSIEGISKEYAPLGSQRIQRMFAYLGGITPDENLLDEEVEDEDDEFETEPMDRSGLGKVVVNDVSLTAHGGSCVALEGPPRAGKSLLLKISAGLVPPTRGRVVVRGLVAPALDAAAAVLPKGVRFGTALPVVAGMVGVPPALVRKRWPEICDLLELPRLGRTFTSSLDGRRRGEVLLATMLALDPDVLLLDTTIPSGPQGERFLERLLELRRTGSLIVAATHDAYSLELAPDRVVRMRRGRIVGDEPYDAVRAAEDSSAEGL